jgi:hypothetical protein
MIPSTEPAGDDGISRSIRARLDQIINIKYESVQCAGSERPRAAHRPHLVKMLLRPIQRTSQGAGFFLNLVASVDRVFSCPNLARLRLGHYFGASERR